MALTLGGPAPVAELANPAAGTVYRVQGGAPLRGEVVIRGAKNSALPIVARRPDPPAPTTTVSYVWSIIL